MIQPAATLPPDPSRPRSVVLLVVVSLALVGLLVGACGLAGKVKKGFGTNLVMCVYVDDQLNGDAPVPVDLVVVYDKKLVGEVTALSAADWFAGRAQLQADHPKQIETWSWEWVPTQRTVELSLGLRSGVAAAVLFAEYTLPGPAYRRVIELGKPQDLRLGAADFTVGPQASACPAPSS